MTSLPQASNDYEAPVDMELSKAAWDAALVSIGARLRAVEALGSDMQAVIDAGIASGQQAVVDALQPILAQYQAEAQDLRDQIALAEDQLAALNEGGVLASSVSVAAIAGFTSETAQQFFAEVASRTLTAGTGLTGGGDLSDNRSFAVDIATDANLRAAAANKIADAAGLRTARSVATLTDGATITPDMNLGPNFTVTLAGNRTLANPTNQAAGQAGFIRVIQDATGSRTLSYGANWKFSGGAPTLSTAANAVDVIAYEVIADGTILATFAGEFS